MRICVVAATGPTGLQVVSQALDRGYEVFAIVRNPLKITQTHEHLKVFKTDIFSMESLEDIIEGSYAVISCLGAKAATFSPVTLYTDSGEATLGAMKRMGVKRFICITSWHTKYHDDQSFIMKWIVRPLFLGRILDNMAALETYIETQCEDLEYTVIRIPGLSNKPKQDSEILHKENALDIKGALRVIPRANVASFILDTLDNVKLYNKIIAIGLKKP